MPPASIIHLCWRKEDAGLPISGEDRSKFEATGFQPLKGPYTEDHICNLHHILKIGATEDEGLLKFKRIVEFKPLESGEAMLWSEEKQCWLRQRGTPTSGVMNDSNIHEKEAYPALPECMRNVERVCVLLETLDKTVPMVSWPVLGPRRLHDLVAVRLSSPLLA